MAYDSLKALIRQYIKTNGEQEITGQILQNVLVEMVNQYPSTDGYATQSWVTSQLAVYATQSWVTTQLGNYLPLTGGTLTGDLYLTNGEKINIILIEGRRIVDLNLGYSQINGTEYAWNMYIESALDVSAGLDMDGVFVGSGFKKIDGTSAQFLKADGSVDSNTYITSASLSGYATQSWVNTQLAGYLPLTGGTLTGDLYLTNGEKINIILIEGRRIVDLNLGYSQINGTEYAWNMYIESALDVSAGLDMDGVFVGSGFKKIDGTSSQFLKADGSVDSNAYITLASVKGNLSAWNNTAMTWGTLTAANGYTIGVHASSSDGGDWGMAYKGGQIFMQLDGYYYQNEGAYRVVDTSDLASYNPTTNFKTINNQSIIGTGNINIEGGGTVYDAEVEYLESSGTQWIDTGIILQANDTVKVTALCTGLGATDYEYLFGARSGNFRTNAYGVFVVYERNYLINYNRTGTETRTSIASNVLTKITTEGNLISCVQGSDTYTATTTGTINDTLVNCYIFCANNSGGVVNSLAKCRLYDFQIIRDGLLLRDFIPVRVGNVGYLYDKVSGELFGNSGTGDFVLGQDTGPGGGLPYLPLTGGTISGNLTVTGRLNVGGVPTNDYGIYTPLDIYAGYGVTSAGRIDLIGESLTRLGIRVEAHTDKGFVRDGFAIGIEDGDLGGSYWTTRNMLIINKFKVGDNVLFVDNTKSFVGIGTSSPSYKLHVIGQVGATGFVNTSDLRKKTIMGDVPINLYNVANAPLFKFTWKDEKKYSGQHIGSAAQYWQTVLPELVIQGSDADMTLAMQYDVIALASAITVAKTVVNHEERIILLERENEALRQEIADLKSA